MKWTAHKDQETTSTDAGEREKAARSNRTRENFKDNPGGPEEAPRSCQIKVTLRGKAGICRVRSTDKSQEVHTPK